MLLLFCFSLVFTQFSFAFGRFLPTRNLKYKGSLSYSKRKAYVIPCKSNKKHVLGLRFGWNVFPFFQGEGGEGMKVKKELVALKQNFFHSRFHFVIACILNVQNFLLVTGGWRWKHLWTGANGLKKRSCSSTRRYGSKNRS